LATRGGAPGRRVVRFVPQKMHRSQSLVRLPEVEPRSRRLRQSHFRGWRGEYGVALRVSTSLGGEPGGGLVDPTCAFTFVHRAAILSATARNNVPAVYPASVFVREGGLLSYGPDAVDMFGRSASYVDRILRGASPAELPVQLPVKFEMAVNVKTAKALGITVPQSILLRADEVIE
jgi:ABC transporter substrate binding protein